MPTINNFCAERSANAFPPEYADLWFLYKQVRLRRPFIWEFGTGISTVVLAKAIFDNGFGYLYSIDDQMEWVKASQKALPTYLAANCTIIYSQSNIQMQDFATVHSQPQCRISATSMADTFTQQPF